MAYSLSDERPHGAALSRSPFAPLRRWLPAALAEFRRRRQLTQLLELDAYRLWDLGITRHDIVAALDCTGSGIDAARDWRQTLDVWPPR